ncbi:MAG: gliding motility-associated C-terminal domain-containing protein [Bacteroidales bacterium]|jgi:gliding motility-associated-like protein|nr:gliding motility-associated C-terminal domain-containing protein [Bacteroidales bacterium]
MNLFFNILKNRILYVFWGLLLCLCPTARAQVFSTKGSDFYVSFGKNFQPDNSSLQIRVAVDAPTRLWFAFTSMGTLDSVDVPAGTVYTRVLTSAERVAVTPLSNGISNHSLHVTASNPVSLYAFNQEENSADASVILPLHALGTDHYMLSYGAQIEDIGGTIFSYEDGYIVVATEDNTGVFVNGFPVSTLQKGQVMVNYARSWNVLSPADYTGTRVTATKPVACFAANTAADIPAGNYFADCLFHQMFPVRSWGKVFLVPVTSRGKERVRVLASENATTLSVTGGTLVKGNAALDRGEWAEYEITTDCYIQSNEPVAVCSYMTGRSLQAWLMGDETGDPSLAWIPPLEQAISEALIAPFVPTGATALSVHHALVLTPSATKDATTVKVGNNVPAPLGGSSWTNHAPSGWSKYPMPLDDNPYTFENENGLLVLGYGLGERESYYYLAGAAMQQMQEEDNTGIYLPVAKEYIACFGAEIELGFKDNPAHPSLKYYWYTDTLGGTLLASDVNPYVVIAGSPPRTVWWAEAREGATVYPRYKVTLKVGDCDPDATGCNGEGTILFKEDFGGNHTSSPTAMLVTDTMPGKVTGLLYATSLSTAGRYSIRKTPLSITGNTITSLRDHTYPEATNRGYMMQVNGNEQPAQYYAYRLDSLCPGTNLHFSWWLMSTITNNATGATYSKVNQIMVLEDDAGNELARFFTGNLPLVTPNYNTLPHHSWNKYSFNYTVPADVTGVTMRLLNHCKQAGNGNDFLLDDIEIRFCTPEVEASVSAYACEGDTIVLAGTYTDDGTLGSPLAFRWLFNATGSTNNIDDWSIAGEGDTLLLSPATGTQTGYYRLAVSTPENSQRANCRAMSTPMYMPVKTINTCIINQGMPSNSSFSQPGCPNIQNKTEAGQYTDTIKTEYGCDSIVIVNLFIDNTNYYDLPQYTACPGQAVILEMTPVSSTTFKWYNTETGGTALGTGNSYTLTKNTAAEQVVWVEANRGGFVYPRHKVTVKKGTCALTSLSGLCAATGKQIFKEDFGGNSASDPQVKTSGIPEVSGYTYNSNVAGAGRYRIAKIGGSNGGWYTPADHTYPGNNTLGYMIQFDATESPGQFYAKEIPNLCPGSELFFSVWLQSVDYNSTITQYDNPANMTFEIRQNTITGKVLAKFYTGDLQDNQNWWKVYGFNFIIPPATTTVYLRIVNNGTGSQGNDFVMDDIAVHVCVPPITVSVPDWQVCDNDSITLSTPFVNDGTFEEPLEYRWYKSSTSAATPLGTAVSDSATLTFNPATPSDAGWYCLAISGVDGIGSENCRSLSTKKYLNVKNNTYATFNVNLCSGQSFTMAGKAYNQTGTYDTIILNKGGCDSIMTLNLTVNDVLLDTIEVSICEGYSYPFAGKPLYLPGHYVDSTKTVAGCDSVTVLHLIVNPVYSSRIDTTLCKGDTFFFNKGKPHFTIDTIVPNNSQLTQNHLFLTTHDCDSEILLIVKMLDLHSEWIEDLCEGECYIFGGDTLCPPVGTWIFRDTLAGSCSCDSIVTLTLHVWAIDSLHFDDTACPTESYAKHGFRITPRDSAGVYDFMLQLKNTRGCDSIISLTLTVPEIGVEIVSSNPDFCNTHVTTLTALTPNSLIYWSTGEQSSTITVSESGTYSVTVSEDGCIERDHIIIETCPSAIVFPNAITPGNNDNLNDYFLLANTEDVQDFSIHIYDRWGQLVFYSTDKYFRWDGRVKGKLVQTVYNYVALVVTTAGKELRFLGSITVL